MLFQSCASPISLSLTPKEIESCSSTSHWVMLCFALSLAHILFFWFPHSSHIFKFNNLEQCQQDKQILVILHVKEIMDDDIDKKYGCWSLLDAPEHYDNILSYLSPRDIYNLGGAIPIVKKYSHEDCNSVSYVSRWTCKKIGRNALSSGIASMHHCTIRLESYMPVYQ